MNTTSRRPRRAVYRSIGQAAIVMLFAGLVVGPATARADDIVLRWNEIAARTATATSPFNQARVGAIVQLAVFEAVNAVTGDYEPYLTPPTVAPAGASVDADDVDDARVYGGIHWRYDQVAGDVLGRAVATEVVKNNLRPVHP